MIRDLFAVVRAHLHARQPWHSGRHATGQDRREFARVPVRVACRLDNRVYGQEAQGTLTNLSLGGAGFSAAVSWPVGSRVLLSLDANNFEADAVIIFRKDAAPDNQFGVRFWRLGVGKLIRLRRILRQSHHGSLTL